MCHNPVVGAKYYEAIHGRETTVKAFTPLESLRSKDRVDDIDKAEISAKPKAKRVRWTEDESSIDLRRTIIGKVVVGKTPQADSGQGEGLS
jgi:hypothetical protein